MLSRKIHEADTLLISSDQTRLGVTREGGQLWPAEFRVGDSWISPLSLTPWADETPKNIPPMLRLLRGDFFCMPFGGNARPFRGEHHPAHGETANRTWTTEKDSTESLLHLSLKTRARKGRVDKFVQIKPGHSAIYQRHVMSGMQGPMSFGHHAMLAFQKQGVARISTSRRLWGQVYPKSFENPAQGGYSCLQPGATFSSLKRVPKADGGYADLSIYPAREGYEDLVMMASKPDEAFAWTAAVVPDEGWLWLALKDPRVLRSTIFWMSNGGRHYAPWNGRHRGVIGVEEVTSHFHEGLAESAASNPVSRSGIPTAFPMEPEHPLTVNYIMAVTGVPKGFDEVRDVRASRNGVTIHSASGKSVRLTVDLNFLHGEGAP